MSILVKSIQEYGIQIERFAILKCNNFIYFIKHDIINFMNVKCNKIIVILAGFFLIFLYAYNIEPNKLIVNEQDLYLTNWDSSLNGMKIAVVSDLHIGTKRVPLRKVEDVAELVTAQNPDFIFVLGDFDALSIQYSKIPREKISNALSGLRGAYAILGNHNYEPANVVEPILKSAGIKLLRDESAYIYYNNTKIRVCGIEDIWRRHVDVKSVLGEINEPTIFLTHNPDSFPQVSDGVALTLAGHNHGGEISFPILGSPLVPSAYGQKYVKGYIIEDGKHLFVTSGVASLCRCRLFNPPEIVILNLYSAKAEIKDKSSKKLLHYILLIRSKLKYEKCLHCH